MAISGVRLTDNFQSDQRPKDWREGILLLFPNGKAPLFALTAGMKKKVADDPEFNWFEKTMVSQRFEVSDDFSNSMTLLTVAADTGRLNGVRLGSIIRFEDTEELLYVDATPLASATTISVSRGWAGTTATGNLTLSVAGHNPNFQVVGNVLEENSSPPVGINYDPTKRNNYTQIFRDTMEISRTAQKTRLRTGDAVVEAKREVLEIHSAAIERALWFGYGVELTSGGINGRPTRGTWGIHNWLLTNASDINVIDASTGNDKGGTARLPSAGAHLGMDDLETFLEICFRFGSQEKMAFCGNEALLKINQAVRLATNTAINLVPGQKEFGMNVMRLITPYGTLVLKSHPLFNHITGGTTGGTAFQGVASWLFVLDMKELVYRFLRDSDTQWQPKLQDNGLDGMQSGYLTECGLEIHHPDTHAILKNIPAAAAG